MTNNCKYALHFNTVNNVETKCEMLHNIDIIQNASHKGKVVNVRELLLKIKPDGGKTVL